MVDRPFVPQGVRPYLRTDDALQALDKKLADQAYKQARREKLDPVLRSHGFKRYKTQDYIRQSRLGILELISLHREAYGSRTFTVDVALIPLWLAQDGILRMGFGDRITKLLGADEQLWWDYADLEIASISFQNVAEAIEVGALPWFNAFGDEATLRDHLLAVQDQPFLGYDAIAWLEGLENRAARHTIIHQNIDELKLPEAWRPSQR